MKAEEIIDKIISRHEDDDKSVIPICEGLHLEPMLNYSGKMARNGFFPTYKRSWHKERKFVGILDHKIMDPTGKMEHSRLLARSLGKVSIDAIRGVYDGNDPFEMNLTDSELALVCDIQCSLMEQEVNWGVNDFQQRTHFGYPEMNTDYLRNAVPRDYLLLFFERCNSLLDSGHSVDEALTIVADPQKGHSFAAGKIVLMPPRTGSAPNVKIRKDFLPFLRSNNIGGAEPWINPFLNRISNLCSERGPSPYWKKIFDDQ